MYAPRHLVFAGQGRLPAELRAVISKRTGAPQPDLPLMAPKLLGLFDNAAEAERVAAGLQRLKIGAAVAGPEQPPADEGWLHAVALELFGGRWHVRGAAGEDVPLSLDLLVAVTILDWRPEGQPVDRAVLLRFSDSGRPVLARASAIDRVSPLSTPALGLQRLGQLLDDCAIAMPTATRVRQRKWSPEEIEAEALGGGDLLPLAIAVIEQIDAQPHTLSRPLSGVAPPLPGRAVMTPTPLAGTAAWALYASSLALGPISLGLFMIAAMAAAPAALVAGVLAAAVGGRRLGWARWLSLARWGAATRVPHWPLTQEDLGRPPNGRDLLLDAALVASTAVGAALASPPTSTVLALLAAPTVGVLGLSALAVVARRRTEA